MLPRRAAHLSGVVLAVLAVAGCGVPAESTARPLTTDDAPLGLLTRGAPTAAPTGAAAESLLFVRDARLVPVRRSTARPGAEAALADLLAGPSEQEQAAGLTTALPVPLDPPPVRVEGGVAEVAVGEDLLDRGRSDQVLALAQVVLTLDAVPGVDAVRFTREGAALPVPREDGSLTDRPLTAADYDELLAAS